MAYKEKTGLLIINTSYKSGYFDLADIKTLHYSKSWNEIHITDINNNSYTFSNESNRDIKLIFEELQNVLYKLKMHQICHYVLDLKSELKEDEKQENGLEL